MNHGNYSMAICIERNDFTSYPLFFVNNSEKTIETLLIGLPSFMSEIRPGTPADDIKDHVSGDEGIKFFLTPLLTATCSSETFWIGVSTGQMIAVLY